MYSLIDKGILRQIRMPLVNKCLLFLLIVLIMKAENRYVYKVIFVGSQQSRKSKLLTKIAEETCDSWPSIGIDFCTKSINSLKKVIKLQIWDTSGQQTFRTVVRSYYRGPSGIFFVYDIGNESTFSTVKDYLQKTKQWTQRNTVKILIGFQAKESKPIVSFQRARKFAKENDMMFWQISHKESKQLIDLMLQEVAEKIYQRHCNQSLDNETIKNKNKKLGKDQYENIIAELNETIEYERNKFKVLKQFVGRSSQKYLELQDQNQELRKENLNLKQKMQELLKVYCQGQIKRDQLAKYSMKLQLENKQLSQERQKISHDYQRGVESNTKWEVSDLLKIIQQHQMDSLKLREQNTQRAQQLEKITKLLQQRCKTLEQISQEIQTITLKNIGQKISSISENYIKYKTKYSSSLAFKEYEDKQSQVSIILSNIMEGLNLSQIHGEQ